ncbi:MAG TPA: WYL domain-containing protein [Blastocatellia bacterium]|nr:WYL domain-containing protein [Blastocatellia bacterium]
MLCAEIQKGRYPTKADLARVIERHPRTVQRTLESLRRIGAPLEFDRKRRGFYFADPDWQFPPIRLSEGELIHFFSAERMLNRLGVTAEAKAARRALKKLAALLPDEVVIDLAALDAAITFAPAPALDAAPEVLSKLAAAAVRRRTLRIDYYSQHRSAHTTRDVDVLLVHNHLGEWYAVCHDHLSGEERDFHAGRISRIEETGRSFHVPADWQPENYLKRGFGMFRGGKEATVAVEFDAYQARYARERTYHATERRRELSDGRLVIEFDTTENALVQVARWVMQFGEHAEALRPAALREIIREHLTRALARYDE